MLEDVACNSTLKIRSCLTINFNFKVEQMYYYRIARHHCLWSFWDCELRVDNNIDLFTFHNSLHCVDFHVIGISLFFCSREIVLESTDDDLEQYGNSTCLFSMFCMFHELWIKTPNFRCISFLFCMSTL